MNIPLVSVLDLKKRIDALLEDNPEGTVVFDADGTLWSHDVGCIVYDAFCERELFREASEASLRREAELHGIAVLPHFTVNQLADALKNAWHDGYYNEKAAAEMQVWAYVNFEKSEFQKIARDILHKNKHNVGLHDKVIELASWIKDQGAKIAIVSASPLWVVEEAVADLPFERTDIAAGVPNTEGTGSTATIKPGLAAPLPYGHDKVVAGQVLLAGSPWLAAFGDSSFDLEMMKEAKLAVGIGRKPALLDGLIHIEHGVRLLL